MKNTHPKSIIRRWRIGFVLLTGIMLVCGGAWAGEGRIEISQSMMPWTITNAGSYIVTEPLSVTSTTTNGLTVTADDVTIDLNGFTLEGPAGLTSMNGIHQDIQFVGLAVRNGAVARWQGGYGIFAGGGKALLRNVRAYSCGFGIRAGEGSVIYECSANTNGFYGISVGEGSVISACTATLNDGRGISASGSVISECGSNGNGLIGISAGNGSVVRRCSSTGNRGDALFVADSVVSDSSFQNNASNGITMFTTCAILGSTIDRNGKQGIWQYSPPTDVSYGSLIKDCIISRNGGDGVNAWNGSAVIDCNVYSNANDGIRIIEAFCMARGNTCAGNEVGIHVDPMSLASGRGSRIEDNTLIENTTGLLVEGYTNLIVQNVASGNTTNWAVEPGNLYHKISNPTNGWPWCNFDY